jgi:predicted lipoprotein
MRAPSVVHRVFVNLAAVVVAAVIVVVPSLLAGCSPPSLPPAGEDERRAFLAALADDVVLPRLQRLEAQAGDLVDATAALSATNGNDDAARASAREALATLQGTWQELEVMHAGPAGAPTTFTGGKGLREGIHSWPQVSPCSVDQQVVQNRMTDPGWAATRLVNVLGLHTLEYLLFRTDNANACPEAASINADGTWAALGDAEVTARRALYARVVAQDVLAKVQTLRAAWMGGFADSLRAAGDDGSLFPTAQQALDEVYAALFFAELKTKDRKIAVPAGLHVDCAAEVCPGLTESPFSGLSLQHIEHNLRGARLVVVGNDGASSDGANGAGTDGAGFDDLLVFAGHDQAAADIVQKLDAALLSTTSFSGSLEDALVTEPERVRALHATVKVFTDELKATLPSLLGLRVPDEGAGDND